MRLRRLAVPASAAAVCLACSAPAYRLPPGDYTPRAEPSDIELPEAEKVSLREAALPRVRVWRQPAVPVAQADLSRNPPGQDGFDVEDDITCRYEYRASSGFSPKFRCVLPGGDVLKVKYGWNSREVRAEVAASRLLSGLGFGADRMYVVRRVRCVGCPPYPHEKLSWFNLFFADGSQRRDFRFVSIEREFGGQALEVEGKKGWGWEELARADPARGGSSRAEVDALRLMAVFLANWDLKYDNQRLVCLDGPACNQPFAFMQDVGTTFGPHSMNLEQWRRRPIWADAATCLVSMRDMPFQGATFVDTRISEAGRAFLAERLGALSAAQVQALFEGARFHQFPYEDDADADVSRWGEVFMDRVRQIAARPPRPEP